MAERQIGLNYYYFPSVDIFNAFLQELAAFDTAQATFG
jgi:hypothetical protein